MDRLFPDVIIPDDIFDEMSDSSSSSSSSSPRPPPFPPSPPSPPPAPVPSADGDIFEMIRCKETPTETLQMAIQQNPEHLLISKFKMMPAIRRHIEFTPLGYACRIGASLDVVRLLIQAMVHHQAHHPSKRKAFTEGLAICFKSTMPCNNTIFDEPLPTEIFRVLVEEYPQGIWDRSGSFSIAGRVIMATRNDAAYWEKTTLILMASQFGTAKEKELRRDGRMEKFRILHAFLKLACGELYHLHSVLGILQFLYERVPIEFTLRDENGDSALHIAVSCPHSSDNTSNAKVSIGFLISKHPESISLPNAQGRLPLHMALENGLPSYAALARQEPRAIETRDPKTKFYPFQIATSFLGETHNGKKRLATTKQTLQAVNTTYRLLRKSPLMAHGLAAKKESWMESDIYKEIVRNELQISQLDLKTHALRKKLKLLQKEESKASSN